MTRLAALMIAGLLACTPQFAGAQEQRPAQSSDIRDWLFEALKTAPTQQIGTEVANQIWRHWFQQAPDATASELMAAATKRRREYDFAGAIEILDKLVEHSPEWAEAWNQRATVLFFQDRFDESLEDVDKVLELEPKHFGALAGKGVILMRQGRMQLSQKALRRAVEIHPWIQERNLLLNVPGEDL
ncbi:tetratricopeptide repeat protein [Tepidamorphus sp. 3E244]|uniref:tetratricopeptide repeat protein n=1 Tax=Tepidamorphus sp. 3E244 TaxID=3385498 RepID=UPI0038FCFBDD